MARYPVKELIVQAVAAALTQISQAHGFYSDGVTVVRPRRTGEKFAPQALGISVLQDRDEPSPDDDLVGDPPAVGRRLSVACDLVLRLAEASIVPMDQALNFLEADARKALMADPTFGGLALRAEIGPAEYPEPAAGVEGLTVWLEVVYRIAENDADVNRV